MFVVMGFPSRDSRVCSSSSSIAAWPAPLAAWRQHSKLWGPVRQLALWVGLCTAQADTHTTNNQIR